MKLTCDNCQTGYQIADEKVPAGGARASCPNCGNQILIPARSRTGKSSVYLTDSSRADFGQTMSYEFEEVDQSSSEITSLLRDASDSRPRFREGAVYTLRDGASGQSFRLDQPEVSLGRSGADIILGDPEVSRKHCLLRVFEDEVLIIDTESTNGTFVKGRRVMTAKLAIGESFTVGNTTLQILVDGKG